MIEPATLIAEQSPDYWPNGPLWDWPSKPPVNCSHPPRHNLHSSLYWVERQFPIGWGIFCGNWFVQGDSE